MTATTMPHDDSIIDPQQWVDRHGDYLYRYAWLRLRRADVAEDLVQEALLAAWRGREQFSGRSTERTWLTAILKRKIADWLRQKMRQQLDQPIAEEEWTEDLFNSRGKWRSYPKNWRSTSPTSELEHAEFSTVLQGCLGKLTMRLRDLFVLWYVDEQPSAAVCDSLAITPSNLWVMLHRARLQLWRCLTINWFGDEISQRKRPH